MSDLARDRADLRRLAAGEAARAVNISPLIRRDTHVLLFAIWSVAILAALLAAWLILAHALAHARQTALSLEQYARRNIALAAFVVEEYEQYLDRRGNLAGIGSDPEARQRLLGLNRWLPTGSVAALVLTDGSVALSTSETPQKPVNFSDRSWFRAHTVDGRNLYVGPAILGRINRQFYYTFSVSYREPDGHLAAVINLGLPSDSITGLLAPGQHDVNMALVQHEGPVVAAQPFRQDMLDVNLALPQPLPETDTTLFGWVLGSYSAAAIRNVPDFGLYAVAALPLAGVLRPLLTGAAIGFAMLLLLSLMLLRQSKLLQQKSAEVEQALADNRVLFQEVHHRVKNNLQVVSSLLRLQTERLPPELKPLMEETGARVRAIALVHEQIYRTASPSVVQLDRFLAQLVQQLQASMIGRTTVVSTDLAPVTIGLDFAVPVAILATEAITNAIKHGLRDGDGTIAVKLRRENGRNLLAVHDSGSGALEPGEAGLGTRIMTALSRQIDGEWSIAPVPGGGTLFRLSWPDPV